MSSFDWVALLVTVAAAAAAVAFLTLGQRGARYPTELAEDPPPHRATPPQPADDPATRR